MKTFARPKILMIYTGGTIGMIENPQSHALEPVDFDHLLDNRFLGDDTGALGRDCKGD